MRPSRTRRRRARGLTSLVVLLIAVWVSAALLAVPATGRTGSISRSRADAIALHALRTKDLAGLVALLGSATPLPAGDVVGAWSMEPRMPTVRLKHAAWLFWEDLEYGAEFAHPSQLVLIDADSGRVVAHMDLTMWPLVNGATPSLVPRAPGGASPRYLVYSSAPAPGAGAAVDVAVRGPTARTADGKITHADLANDCLITIGDRRLTQGFNADFKAIGEWAGRYKLDRSRADPSPAGLEKAVFQSLAKGCTDFLIYVAGHGRYPKGGKVDGVPDHYGPFAPPPGDYPGFDKPGIGLAAQGAPEGDPTTFLTPDDVSHLIGEFTKPGKVTIDGKEHELTQAQVANVKFKLKLQTCYAGWFAQVLLKDRGITPGDHKADPLLLVETSSSATESSWDYLPAAFVQESGKEVPKQNPRKVPPKKEGEEEQQQPSEATYANVQGLETWAQNPTAGRTLVDGLTQSFQNGTNLDFTRSIGWTHPQLLGGDYNLGTPDPTTATTKLTTHEPPKRRQGGGPPGGGSGGGGGTTGGGGGTTGGQGGTPPPTGDFCMHPPFPCAAWVQGSDLYETGLAINDELTGFNMALPSGIVITSVTGGGCTLSANQISCPAVNGYESIIITTQQQLEPIAHATLTYYYSISPTTTYSIGLMNCSQTLCP